MTQICLFTLPLKWLNDEHKTSYPPKWCHAVLQAVRQAKSRDVNWGSKQLHTWNAQYCFANSPCNFYGATIMIKGRLQVRFFLP